MTFCRLRHGAAIAQLGERQTEDLEVPGSIPGLGTFSTFIVDGRGTFKLKVHDALATKESPAAVWSSGMILP